VRDGSDGSATGNPGGAGGIFQSFGNTTNPTFPYISGGTDNANAPRDPVTPFVNATKITDYPTMSGLSGGNIGFPGASDSETVAVLPLQEYYVGDAAVHSSFNLAIDVGGATIALSAAYNVRRGGAAGMIVGDFGSQVLTGSTGTGTYTGDASNISVS
jgi:hypothetical protein